MARGVPAGLTRIRKPVVAGLFYPAQPAVLLATVQQLLEAPPAEVASAVAVIVPHSGFQYSGRTAGRTLATVDVPRCCIVLAPNHTGAGAAANAGSAWAVGAYRTPMADVPVDETLAAALLARCPLLEDDPAAHKTEHGIEVVLPFLVARRPDVAIVPVIVGWPDWPRTRQLGEALADVVKAAGEPVLLVASSDLSHFEKAAVGREKDDLALEPILRLDGEELLEVTRRHRVAMCGRAPVAAVLHAARLLGAAKGEVLDRGHSGEATEDESAVVGYAGVVIR